MSSVAAWAARLRPVADRTPWDRLDAHLVALAGEAERQVRAPRVLRVYLTFLAESRATAKRDRTAIDRAGGTLDPVDHWARPVPTAARLSLTEADRARCVRLLVDHGWLAATPGPGGFYRAQAGDPMPPMVDLPPEPTRRAR